MYTYAKHAVGQAYRTCADVDVREMEEEIEEGAIRSQVQIPADFSFIDSTGNPYTTRENARENPRFSRTLGFTIQLDTVCGLANQYNPILLLT